MQNFNRSKPKNGNNISAVFFINQVNTKKNEMPFETPVCILWHARESLERLFSRFLYDLLRYVTKKN